MNEKKKNKVRRRGSVDGALTRNILKSYDDIASEDKININKITITKSGNIILKEDKCKK